MFFLICGLVVLGMFGKSSSKVLFHDVRPWLLIVILSLSTSNIDDEFDIGTIVRINAAKLLDAYALQFFHGEIDSEAFRKAREPLFKEIVGAVIMDAYAFAFRNPQLRRSLTSKFSVGSTLSSDSALPAVSKKNKVT
jgi:hypothetical protein